MALTTGPNIGLLDNGSPGEAHYAELMRLWRWTDFWLQPIVKSRVAALPTTGQLDGDTYIITAAGADQHKIARWTTRITTPAWEYVAPKTGWRVHVSNELDANNQVKTIEFVGGTWVDRIVASGGVASVAGKTGVVTLVASDVGAIAAADKGATNGVASLDASGKIPEAQLPALVINDAFAVASEAAMLALTAQRGDIAIRSDINKSFVLAAEPATTLANWLELRAPTAAAGSETAYNLGATLTGAVTMTATNGALQYGTVTGAVTWTFAGASAAGIVSAVTLELTNAGSAAQTWPTSVKWDGGTAPALTATGVDILEFYTRDGGATWRGFLAAKDSK